MQDFIRIHENDNVMVALRDIAAGEEVDISGGKITALEPIPTGHKMAIRDIPAGGAVVKYGHPIGNTKDAVMAGSWIHTHNLKTALGDLLEYEYAPVFNVEASDFEASGMPMQRDGEGGLGNAAEGREAAPTFQGFLRPDGRVGVRNEIWIIPTVGCVNNVATAIAAQANRWLADFRSAFRGTGPGAEADASPECTVEEVVAFPHPYGCSQMGEDQECARRILADLVNHPNAGGVLVLGLGCENSNIDVLKPYIMECSSSMAGGHSMEEEHSGGYDGERVKFLVAQECGDEVEQGLEIVKSLIRHAATFRREPVSADRLIVGLKCGGSDGLSGITANPLVGRFSDKLVAAGGTTILTEVPEMFGAETILMNRCANEELFRRTVALINDFKNYFKSHNQTIYENPSPGNKKGGISTLEEKSLGCTQKSGSAPVRGVLQYGETVWKRGVSAGLNLLSAPGNDLVASTALAAAGAHIVLFTTGRGTPFACPVPTVKISTNSALAARKSGWIDFNAGVLAEDGSMDEESERLFRYVLEVASGRKVRSEEAGYHDMAIFKQGVTL